MAATVTVKIASKGAVATIQDVPPDQAVVMVAAAKRKGATARIVR